jgi:glucosamine--fructose-6-phosphate aminotransferase (isomerizing)
VAGVVSPAPRRGSWLRRGGGITVCGIVGCVGDVDVVDRLLAGLDHLDYRGYDSAGAAVGPVGLAVEKRAGRVSDLRTAVDGSLAGGSAGIGHTRWSTHGAPTDENAHPHTDCTGRVAVVHNGVVENYDELRSELEARGHEFDSDTDTEVVPHLVEEYVDGHAPVTALRRTVADLEGSYALAVLVEGFDAVYAARQDSPLAVGVGDDANYVASDVPAFLEHTDQVVYLEDGDVAVVHGEDHRVFDGDGHEVTRPVRTVEWVLEETRKGSHDHFMRKEIFEQPESVARTIEGRVGVDAGVDLGAELARALSTVREVQFVACGTSYHASLYGQELLVGQGVPATASLASEYAGQPRPVDDGTLVVGVTQSGETADTLSALRAARDRGARTLAVTNVQGSTAARECDLVVEIRAGPEIGVAATKTFSSQVATLAMLADVLGGGDGPGARERRRALRSLPGDVGRVLEGSRAATVAREYRDSDAYFFIGRGVAHPVAMEGALKLKEISYEHAEGFPAGELKHGPLALVTGNTPVVAVLTGDRDEETLTNVEEVSARDAPVVAVADHEVAAADHTLRIPETHPDLAPVLANVHLQLFSYHLADLLDRPIDKPRNLAKSVTVE